MGYVAGQTTSRKAGLWDDYVNTGLTRLHAIIPPGAAPSSKWLSLKTTPNPRQNGRCLTPERALAFWQGKHAVGKLPGFWWHDGWAPRNVQGDESVLARVYDPKVLGGYRWAVEQKGGGIGVSGTELIGLDIDVVDAGWSVEVLHRVLGLLQLPADVIRRVGRAPKLLIPFRLAAGAAAFTKPSRLELGTGIGAVEWLTTGQQWVLEGVHGGTGRPYAWPCGRLWERGGLAGLPEVDEDGAVGLLRGLGRALGLAGGGTGIRRGGRPGAHVDAAGGRETAAARAARVAALLCAEADARAMVAAIPNVAPATHVRGTPREDYVAMAHHLLGCSGGAAWGRELFLEWAGKWPGDDPGYDEDLWDGLSEPRSGWQALLGLAEKSGWPGGVGFRAAQARRAFARVEVQTIGQQGEGR